MEGTFSKYLFLHHGLSLPEVGDFSIVRKTASLDFINKQLHPPLQEIIFSPVASQEADERLYKFIASAENISEIDAIFLVSKRAKKIKYNLQQNNSAVLEGIGTLYKNESGISFHTEINNAPYFETIVAERVLRDDAEHTLLVGEQEKNSSEMHELLGHEEKPEKWWITALVLAVLAIAMIALYYL